MDGWLGAGFAVLLAGWAAQLAHARGGDQWWFDVAAGAVVCAVALTRDRGRGRMAVAGLVVAGVATVAARVAGLPGEPGPAMTLALAVLAGAAIRTLPVLRAGVIAGMGLVVVVLSGLAARTPGVPPVLVLSGAGWCGALAVGLNLRLFDAHRRVVAGTVRRDERLALARELHDVVAHHITGIVVQAQAARLVAGRRPEQAVEALAGIETAGSDALDATRRVVGVLRDTADGPPATSGPESLSDLTARFAGHGPAVRLRLPAAEPSWPPEITSTVYRVVQESLTNVSRHAPHATAVTVTVTENGAIGDGGCVVVEVADDAPPGQGRPHRGGYGLTGMRERLEALGGTLYAGPGDAGWRVRATLPIGDRRRR